MGMEMRDHNVPDTFGLPEFRVTKIIKQRVGDEIHFLMGNESFGQTHWHFIMVMKADDVMRESQITQQIILEAMRDGKAAH